MCVCGPIASATKVTTDSHGSFVEVINIGDTLAVSYYCWIIYYVPINIHTINNCYAALFLSIIVIMYAQRVLFTFPCIGELRSKSLCFCLNCLARRFSIHGNLGGFNTESLDDFRSPT